MITLYSNIANNNNNDKNNNKNDDNRDDNNAIIIPGRHLEFTYQVLPGLIFGVQGT